MIESNQVLRLDYYTPLLAISPLSSKSNSRDETRVIWVSDIYANAGKEREKKKREMKMRRKRERKKERRKVACTLPMLIVPYMIHQLPFCLHPCTAVLAVVVVAVAVAVLRLE